MIRWLSVLLVFASFSTAGFGVGSAAAADGPWQPADRAELDADVSGLFSPHVRVRHARAYDVEVALEYVAPGVSNFKLMEQAFRRFVEQRRAEGRSRLLEWDMDQLDLFRVHFTDRGVRSADRPLSVRASHPVRCDAGAEGGLVEEETV